MTASLKIVNKTAALSEARIRASELLEPAIKKAVNNISVKIKRRVIVHFRRHPVLKGIAGNYPGNENKDLQAIFGLEDEVAKDAIQQILQVVEDSITVSYKRSGGTYRFYIRTSTDLLDKIESIQAGTYDYTTARARFKGNQLWDRVSGEIVNIPWMKWLLEGATASADLTFDLTPRQQQMSRTKRATMENTGNGHWQFEGRADFITEIGTSDKLLEEAEKIFYAEIQRQIDKVQ